MAEKEGKLKMTVERTDQNFKRRKLEVYEEKSRLWVLEKGEKMVMGRDIEKNKSMKYMR